MISEIWRIDHALVLDLLNLLDLPVDPACLPLPGCRQMSSTESNGHLLVCCGLRYETRLAAPAAALH